ncbi:MAG: rhomboid family intramembrane serine protease [Planctomycetota bacterium]|nr:rhomboid family intramembrane serine protease [Planctomycetota bacterium]
MMPLYDDNSQRIRTPFVNYTLIAINIFVFAMFQNFGENERFVYTFSAVPAEIISGKDIQSSPTVLGKTRSGEDIIQLGLEPTPFTVYITLITSMFMHGDIGHILGNMLFLWIFGDNVEDRLGHLQYLLFYIIVGILASLAHVATCVLLKSDLLTPSLGASGAISGVMGAYLLFYPNNSVTVLIFRFVTTVPAMVAVGLWFAMQLFSSFIELGAGEGGGVAYGAHIGGFIAGIPLAFFIDKTLGEGKQNASWTQNL